MWIRHVGNPKQVTYDWMWGWIADVDDYDQPHIIIDWPYIMFDEFTNDVKECERSGKHYGIGFSNEDACYEYCAWKEEQYMPKFEEWY